MRIATLLLSLLLTFPLAAQSPSKGIWLAPAEIGTLPITGSAWEAVKSTALGSWSTPNLSDQDSKANCQVLAGAYYAVRIGHAPTRDRVRSAVKAAPATVGGRTLALGRELPAYVIAADLVGFATQGEEDSFKAFLRSVRTKVLDGKTLISTQEVRPNNWGTQASFALAVVNRYLDDEPAFTRCATVFRGWLGDRTLYSDQSSPGFDYGELDWQSDRSKPVGINPRGSTISGHSVDGALPEEMRRAGGFEWPPPCENYAWTGYTPALAAAWVFSRSGYPTIFAANDSALLRAITWLHTEANCPAEGNDVGTSWLANSIYGTTFRVSSPASMSREIAWLDWTHRAAWGPLPEPEPEPEDFLLEFSFQYQSETKSWVVNAIPPKEFQPGAGATPGAALSDWTVKNPTF